jgi:hypothetical protein
MARDILSVPSMADENERIFSGSRRTLRYDRMRLSSEHMEMTECMVNWLDGGHIASMYVSEAAA